MKDTTVGAVISHKDRYLICRATNCYMPSGEEVWGFPKGIRDKQDTTTIHTCLRELEEETGLTIQKISPYVLYDYYAYSTKKKNVMMYFFEVEKEVMKLELFCKSIVEEFGYPEIDKYLWATLDETEKLVTSHMRQVVQHIKSNLSLKTN